MNSNFRNLALWAIIGVMLIALFNLFQNQTPQGAADEIAYSKFLDEVETGRVKSVVIAGKQITGTYSDNSGGFVTFSPEDPQLVTKLEAKGVEIEATPPNEGSALASFFFNWLPIRFHSNTKCIEGNIIIVNLCCLLQMAVNIES